MHTLFETNAGVSETSHQVPSIGDPLTRTTTASSSPRIEVGPQQHAIYSSDALYLDNALSWRLGPLGDGATGHVEADRDFRDHSTLAADQFHTVQHNQRLPSGSIIQQSESQSRAQKCLPAVNADAGNPVCMSLGNRIAAARAMTGMTQRTLASAIAVSPGLVGQWESHKKFPGRDNLLKIARVCDITVEELMGGKEFNPLQLTLTMQEAQLVRSFRLLSKRQQDRLSAFIGESVDVRFEFEDIAAKPRKQTPGSR